MPKYLIHKKRKTMPHVSYKFIILVFCFFITLNPLFGEDYKSEGGQDRFVNEAFFQNKKGGTFIEIGAHDGLNISNTWFFEKKLGWTGICIEPRLSAYEKLIKNRECICINGAITPLEGYVTFRECEGEWVQLLSGIESNLINFAKDLIEREVNKGAGSCKSTQVYGYVLNNLLEKYNFLEIDFLSLDIEGGELEVLKSINFNKFHFRILAVENHFDKKDMEAFLKSNGFIFAQRVGLDDIYVNTIDYTVKQVEAAQEKEVSALPRFGEIGLTRSISYRAN